MDGSALILAIFGTFVLMGLMGSGDMALEDDDTPTVDPDLPIGDPVVDDPVVDDPVVGDPVPADPLAVASGATFTGTDADDTFNLASPTDELAGATVTGGAGDDIIDLLKTTDGTDAAPVGSLDLIIDGGIGNDVITANAESSTVTGGEGDDTITIFNGASTSVYGGDGSDTLTGSQSASDGMALFGDAGDDVIDGTGMENGALFGGEGNDQITFQGFADQGAGYAVFANGGAGDDTIIWNGSAITDSFYDPTGMAGGEGADAFLLTINEGGLELLGGTPDEQSADGTTRFLSVAINDFTPGEDVAVINSDPATAAFTLTTARIETVLDDNGNPFTGLILRYESETEPARDVIIDFGSADLSFDDITFAGEQKPTLV